MSGRGRGRSSGRGSGRGRGSSNKNKSKSKGSSSETKKEKTLQDHMYHIGSGKNSAVYEKNTDFILSHIRKKFIKSGYDVAKALAELKDVDLDQDMPVPKTSTLADATLKDAQQKQHDAIFAQEIRTLCSGRKTTKPA